MNAEAMAANLSSVAASERDTKSETVSAQQRWGKIHAQCRLAEAGISLERFLTDPRRILREQGQEGAVASIGAGHLPLLPEQARIARRIRDEVCL